MHVYGSACLVKTYKSLYATLISEALLLQSQLAKPGRGGSFSNLQLSTNDHKVDKEKKIQRKKNQGPEHDPK